LLHAIIDLTSQKPARWRLEFIYYRCNTYWSTRYTTKSTVCHIRTSMVWDISCYQTPSI